MRVPFGRRREVVGVVVGASEQSALAHERLKRISQVIDNEPVLSDAMLALLSWAADYYHHPIGEVLHAALPALLRRGRTAAVAGLAVWRLTAAGRVVKREALTRAPLQRKLLEALAVAPDGMTAAALANVSRRWSSAIKVLQAKGWVGVQRQAPPPVSGQSLDQAPELNPAQREAVAAIAAGFGAYQCCLLHGITGSGKTEVYLRAIEQTLAQGRQALVLVPEIGLTPQLVQRFKRRICAPIVVLHSGLSDQERLDAWLLARAGKAAVVLGTRSAVFTPLKNPGLIVVDEEHDTSYKQQDGFRYSARDVAVMRASREGIPIVLGSATPSLESLNNARQGSYRLLELPERTGNAGMPSVAVLDMRRLAPVDGLSHPLRMAIAQRLDKGEQSLLFLNRRGFAPVWMCHGCGWVAPCRRCDAKLTLHHRRRKLICHHCGTESKLLEQCPACGDGDLHPLGEGTERVEAALTRLFPRARIVRIDRDSTRRKGALDEKLKRVHEGEADILVGTQMLSKGHDFPNVTLVGVVNADQGLYSVDFRSGERLFQQMVQVSGRAGRGDKPGQVLLQTYHPDNPVFAALLHQDYREFADFALEERRQTHYPPFSHLAMLRAESPKQGSALKFLHRARDLAGKQANAGSVEIMEPVPSPMERRAGRYRAQLLVQSRQRGVLQRFLSGWMALLTESREGKRVRWSLDVDPIDMH